MRDSDLEIDGGTLGNRTPVVTFGLTNRPSIYSETRKSYSVKYVDETGSCSRQILHDSEQVGPEIQDTGRRLSGQLNNTSNYKSLPVAWVRPLEREEYKSLPPKWNTNNNAPDNLPALDLDWLDNASNSNKRQKRHDVSKIHEDLENLTLQPNENTTDIENAQHDDVPYWYIVMQPDNEGDNILFLSIILKRTHLTLMLIDLIPYYKILSDANRLFQTALHLAALTDNYTVTRRLVVAGAKVHLQDHNGNTPLHIACIRGNYKVAEALLTPVRYSEAIKNSYEIPYQAIPQNLEIRNFQGQTCMILATIYKRTKIMELLLENDADINSFDMKTGKTCLHIASEDGDISLVQFITAKPRVRLDAQTYSGYTATELAHYRNHHNVVYILRLAGASQPRAIQDIEDEDED